MSSLVVILSPSRRLDGIKDALRDWSASGKVAPFLWIDQTSTSVSAPDAVMVAGGREYSRPLMQLAGTGGHDRVRVVSLTTALSGVEEAQGHGAQEFSGVVVGAFGGLPTTVIRAIVTRSDDPARVTGLAYAGWHNVLLSPESSLGPGIGSRPLTQTDDIFELGRHAAQTLAGVVGLWSELPESVFDRLDPLPGETVRLARSYYRRLDSREIEHALRQRLFASGDEIPLPTHLGFSAQYIPDTPLAVQNMAKLWWRKHESAFVTAREAYPAVATKKIGALRAIALFVGYLWSALLGAPGQWARQTLEKVRAGAASAVQNAVFGAHDSAWEVVVKGRTRDGRPADWSEIAAAGEDVAQAMAGGGAMITQEAKADFAGQWNDYANAVLTLADGGARAGELPPVMIGNSIGVVRSAGDLVAARGDEFDGIPPFLKVTVGDQTLVSYDYLAIDDTKKRLQTAINDPSSAAAASAALNGVEEWWRRTSSSFAAQLGWALGSSVRRVQAEIGDILARLDALRNTGNDDSEAQRQRRLRRLMRVLVLLGLVGFAVIGILGASGVIASAVVLVVTLVSWLLAWLSALFVSFIRGQAKLFQAMNMRQQLASRADVDERNLALALRDLRRLGQGYSEFLAWSRVLAVIVRTPYGTVPDISSFALRTPADLPQPMRVGSVVVEESTLSEVAYQLSRTVFQTGWLSEAWEAALANAPTQLGTPGARLRDNPRLMLSEAGEGDQTLLLPWAEVLEHSGVNYESGEAKWRSVLAELQSPARQQLFDALVQRVRVLGERDQVMTRDEFMARIDDSRVAREDRLDHSLLIDSARAADRSRVELGQPIVQRAALGAAAVLTQLSGGIPEFELSYLHVPAEESGWGAPAASASGSASRGDPDELGPFQGASF